MSAMQTQRTTLDEFVGVDPAPEPAEPDCDHMDQWKQDGECYRCSDNVGRTAEERDAERDLVDGFEPRGLR